MDIIFSKRTMRKQTRKMYSILFLGAAFSSFTKANAKKPTKYADFKEEQTLAENHWQSNLSSSKNSLRGTVGFPLLAPELNGACCGGKLSPAAPSSSREELEGSASPSLGWQRCLSIISLRWKDHCFTSRAKWITTEFNLGEYAAIKC